ncbi:MULTISPECIES: helix-turn-helix domain-containing protein [Vibrio]|uniref:helix-turn-helix domain-containing protein n=1 Tax=Vibrio TaxID=662 RepID=UPI00076A5DC1|nr:MULTISPECIES: helix-turn-helix transcriptional regulator [Vibrio]
MIRYKIKELVEIKSLREKRKITLSEVAEAVGVQSSAMSKLANNKGYTTTTTTLNELCKFFECKIEELIEYIPE